ncbi:MAG: hypothetical protein AAFY60_00050 [Myxococcota bacterium]
MVGKSGKVGGPGGPPLLGTDSPAEMPGKASKAPAKPNDSFSRASRAQAPNVPAQNSGFTRDVTGASNLFQLARANPEAAKQMVASLTSQASATLSELESARVAAQAVMEKLAKEKFTKEAVKKQAEELRKQREKISSLKLRHQMASRKMALLQQIAGKLGDPRLDDEIDKLLSQYKKHKTDWGRRYNALAMGQSLYGDLADTPEHLQEVVKANVHPVGRARELGEAFEELSPRKVISELIARSIDGSTRVVERDAQTAARRGEYGKSVQNYAFLSEIMEDSLGRDPLKDNE